VSYEVFARKYRPQTFDDLVGQAHVSRTLKNAVAQNRLAHAYLFVGPRGVGKTSTARILAKSLNCVKGPTITPCGECDNCRHPKERVEAKDNAVKALKAIKALDERFASDYTVNVIVGKLTPQLMMFRHEGLAEFGIGNDETEYYWNSLIRQLLLEDLLKKDIEEYGVLKLTKKGEDFLKKPRSFKIVLNNLFEEANADDEEEGDADRRHEEDDRCLIDERAQHQPFDRKGQPDHDRRRAQDRQRQRHDLHQPDQRQRRKQAHRPLREVEDGRGLENQDKAERYEGIQHSSK